MSDIRVGITVAIADGSRRTVVLALGNEVIAEKVLPLKRYRGTLVGAKVIQQADGNVATWVILQEANGVCHDLPLDVWTVRQT